MRVFWRPICAAVVMAGAVVNLQWFWPDISVAALLAQVALGVVSFGMAMAALWLAAGRPDGAERFALLWLSSVRKRS
jgi:hypothetical protein